MSDLRFVACGGGNPVATALPHLRAALELTGTAQPNILVIPTAKTTAESHAKICASLTAYGAENGLDVKELHDFQTFPSLHRAIELLEWADLVYVTGGDTDAAMEAWRNWNLGEGLSFADVFLTMASAGDFVAFGISFGLLVWFTEGFSDSDSYRVKAGTSWQYRPVPCLGLLPECLADVHHDRPHPVTRIMRNTYFRRELRKRKRGALGLGVENGAALQIIGRGTNQLTVQILHAPDAGGGLVHRYFHLGGDNDIEDAEFDTKIGVVNANQLFI
jgi:peptidase E